MSENLRATNNLMSSGFRAAIKSRTGMWGWRDLAHSGKSGPDRVEQVLHKLHKRLNLN